MRLCVGLIAPRYLLIPPAPSSSSASTALVAAIQSWRSTRSGCAASGRASGTALGALSAQPARDGGWCRVVRGSGNRGLCTPGARLRREDARTPVSMSWYSCTSTTCLPAAPRSTRPTCWTSRPVNAIGAARNRVSRTGHVGTRRHHEQRPGVRTEPFESGAALPGPHPAPQNDWIVSGGAQQIGENRHIRGPLGEDQAVSPTGERPDDVVDHLPVAGRVGDEVAVDGGDPAGGRGVAINVPTTALAPRRACPPYRRVRSWPRRPRPRRRRPGPSRGGARRPPTSCSGRRVPSRQRAR